MVLCCVPCWTGCDDRAPNQADARYYQQQEQILKRQNAEWERQLRRAEAQDERYDALLDKCEEHVQRVHVLLDRWEQVLRDLEERSGDQ
jgi:hypothetical protein